MDDATRDLVTQARAGNRAAFESLIRSFARSTYADIAFRVRDKSLAEDLTQDSFLRAWKSLRSLKSPDLFPSWLSTIARSVVIDHRRRHLSQKRGNDRPHASDPDTLASLESTQPPDAHALQHEQLNQVLDALNTLPEDQRKVLTLRYLAHADDTAIRLSLTLTDPALRGLLSRALTTLRTRLNPQPIATKKG